jgi:predicted GNAT family N-acyltransferase
MYRTVTTLTPPQVDQLLHLYQQTWWAADRQLADVQRMLSRSDYLFGLCDAETDVLVGFARVLTDQVYRAIVFDVVVDAAQRGSGLGRLLIQQVINHPVLSQVECIQLFCTPDMRPFYQKYGFEETDQLLLKRPRSQG